MEEVHEKVDKIKINQSGGLREKCKVEEEQGEQDEQDRWDESGGPRGRGNRCDLPQLGCLLGHECQRQSRGLWDYGQC